MTPRHARWPIQVFRLGSLVLPPVLAWDAAFSAPHPTGLDIAVHRLLAPLWAVTATALLVRAVGALARRRGVASLLDRLDVLTASGSALMWTAAAAVVGSVWVGWASLAIVGLLGICFVQLVVLRTLVVAGGDDPFRRASIARTFVPGSVFEGDPVIEQVRLSGPRIPSGFRLFVSGRVGPRWAESRHVVEEAASGGETLLESDVGPAIRGEHHPQPLEAWLQDVFGLCHSPRTPVFEDSRIAFTVLPRLREVEGAKALLGKGGHDLEPRPAALPTEGSLRLREYQPGDDARRIHWVRSLAAREVVVRLPDELPPDKPAVQLVLDTFLEDAGSLSCAAHEEMLDALVRVWLGVGRALVDSGTRVTLVAAARASGGELAPHRRRLGPQSLTQALHLGAGIAWQETLRIGDLVKAPARKGAAPTTIVVSHRLQADPPGAGPLRWILAPVSAWARFDEPLQQTSLALLPHPMGTAENRWSRRRRERVRLLAARRDRATFLDDCAPTRERDQLAGSFCARPAGNTTPRIRLEAL